MAQIVAATTAKTLDDVVSLIRAEMQGWVRDLERTSYLVDAITASDLTIQIPSGVKSSSGTVEVDYEQIWVSDTDSTNGTLTVPPFGRAQAGSIAAPHGAGARLVFAPRFPKVSIVQAVNSTVRSIGTVLPASSVTSFTYNAAVMTYGLPSEAEKIQLVSYQSLGPSLRWVPVDMFDFDPAANTTAFPTGKTISLIQGVPPGRTVQVSYTHTPSELTDSTQMFTDTGLPLSCADVVVYGAAAILSLSIQASVVDFKAVGADILDNQGQGNQEAGNLSRYYYALYQSRLQDEVRKFWQVNQPRVRKLW